jgi:cyclopropane-fatty-acyl-phospholipid synthase
MQQKRALPGGLTLHETDRIRASSRAWAPERRLVARLLQLLGSPAVRVTLWDGTVIEPHPGRAAADVLIRDRATLFAVLARQDLGFGDAFGAGGIEVRGDLVALLEEIFRAWNLQRPARGLLRRLRRPRHNTLLRARRNIHHHYDLGNDFYALWLDERMLYTCAYFAKQEMDLEQAQLAKMDHVCRKLRLVPGERVVEAGCGWGSLALHMAQHYGVSVRACNISREQIRHARAQAQRLGLAERVEFVEDDYRNLNGSYDAFVSVGMLEHVGRSHYADLGRMIDRTLSPRGRGLIHSIGRMQPQPLNRWIERRIFPGAYPPTLVEMMQLLQPFDLSVLDVENLRPHYARTIEHWLSRFEKARNQVRERYGEPFERLWRLYLAGSIAAFRTGALELFQVVFTRAREGEFPWTREALYRDPHAAV